MNVKLYTSLSGIQNAVNGKRVYTVDKPTQLEDIEITVDVKEIESVDENGGVILKATKAEINYAVFRCPEGHGNMLHPDKDTTDIFRCECCFERLERVI